MGGNSLSNANNSVLSFQSTHIDQHGDYAIFVKKLIKNNLGFLKTFLKND